MDDRDEYMINHLVAMDNGYSNSFLPFSSSNLAASATAAGTSNNNNSRQSNIHQQHHLSAHMTQSEIQHQNEPPLSPTTEEDPKERILQLSTSPTKNLILAPFCVACQAHTANVAFINCGHVCLCVEHYDQMPTVEEDLRRCPLCSKNSRVCKLTGLSRN